MDGMINLTQTSKSVDEAFKAVSEAVVRHGFAVLHSYDLKAKMAEKGIAFPNDCRILEICNSRVAAEVLGNDMAVSTALPCRISIFEEKGKTTIGTLLPTALLGIFPGSVGSKDLARSVEASILAMIKDSV